jgi:hypothetical protein
MCLLWLAGTGLFYEATRLNPHEVPPPVKKISSKIREISPSSTSVRGSYRRGEQGLQGEVSDNFRFSFPYQMALTKRAEMQSAPQINKNGLQTEV